MYFDVPNNTTIRGVTFAAAPTGATGGDYLEAEVSLSSSNQTATNDAQGIIATAAWSVQGGGSPANASAVNGTVAIPANCPAKAGERVYLNYTENGGATWRTRALVWFD